MRTAVAASMIAFQLFGMCVAITLVGKPRKPLSADAAVGTVLISLAFMLGVYWLWAS